MQKNTDTSIEKLALTQYEAAQYIGLSESKLAKGRCYGTLENHIQTPPFIRYGQRGVRYLKADLDAWLAQFPRQQQLGEDNV